MMIQLVIQEFWRRYKLVMILAGLCILTVTVLHLTGLVWDFENWVRGHYEIKKMNPILLFTFLIAICMTIDHHRQRSRR